MSSLIQSQGEVVESNLAAAESPSDENGHGIHQMDENVSTLVSCMNVQDKVESKVDKNEIETQPARVPGSGEKNKVQNSSETSSVDPKVDNKGNKKSNECDKERAVQQGSSSDSLNNSAGLPANIPAKSDTSNNICTKQAEKTEAMEGSAAGGHSTLNASKLPHILISPAVSGGKAEAIVQKTIEKSNASFTFDLNSDTKEGSADRARASPTSIDPHSEDASKQLSDPANVGQPDSGVFTVHTGEVEEDKMEEAICKDKNSVDKHLELVVCKQRPPSSKARELKKLEEDGKMEKEDGTEKVENESGNGKQDKSGKNKEDESGKRKQDESGNRKQQESRNCKQNDSGNVKQDDCENRKQDDCGNRKQDDCENRKQDDCGNRKQDDCENRKQDDCGNRKQDDCGNRKQDDCENRKQDDCGNKKQDDSGNGKQGDESEEKKVNDKTGNTKKKATTGDGGKDRDVENRTEESGTENGAKAQAQENGTIAADAEKGREVPGKQDGKMEVPDTQEGKMEVPDTQEGKMEVPGTQEGKMEVPDTQEGKMEVPDKQEGKMEVPGTQKGKMEVPDTQEGKKEVPDKQQGKIMSVVGTPAPRSHSRAQNRTVHGQDQKRRRNKHITERAKFENCLSGIAEATATQAATPNNAGATNGGGEAQSNKGDYGVTKLSRNEIVLSDKSVGKNDNPSKVNLSHDLALAIPTQVNRDSKPRTFTNSWSPREKHSPRKDGWAETKMESPRISSSRSSKISSFDSNKSSPRVPSSIIGRPFSRQELRQALPRKSFFSSHDKAMKDAGYQVEDDASKKKAERLKARLEKIANEFNPLPSKQMIRTAGENQENQNDNIQVVVTDTSKTDGGGEHADGTSNEIDTIVDANTSDNTTSAEAHDGTDSQTTGSLKPGLRQGKRKPAESGKKSEYVECKPLSHYLEYVRDNKQEYLQHELTASGQPRHKAVSRLIKMGQAFQLRHHGGVTRQQHDEDILVRAAKALRPRTADVSRMGRQPSARSVLRSGDVAHRQARPSSEDKRQEKNQSPSPAAAAATKEEDQPKTEMEKRKVKAEDWTRSVSTNTLTRARIQCLRELGADDVELTKWWDAFRNCHYLRHKSLGIN